MAVVGVPTGVRHLSGKNGLELAETFALFGLSIPHRLLYTRKAGALDSEASTLRASSGATYDGGHPTSRHGFNTCISVLTSVSNILTAAQGPRDLSSWAISRLISSPAARDNWIAP